MRRILIVDDDVALSDIIKEMLENYEYEVDQAYNVEEAFDRLTDGKFDLVLLDINLPDGEGFEVVRSSGRYPRFLLFSPAPERAG